ncbi:MAG: rRNA maturation RNase YbeY [Deltaproteobacteria bacterium]|jgi:probable rRNA maturation factor|nr:rRNA maturation RNase YbeY [Deltaproteobacteria bacterium]
MSIYLVDEKNLLAASRHKITRRLASLLKELGHGQGHLTVFLTDDEEIRRLNKIFRGVDKSTNVLAFPDTDLAVGRAGYLGDLALSVPTLRREAKENGHDLGYLLFFYLIHGLLHLLGYDHEKGKKEEEDQDKETIRLMSLIKHDL